MMTYEQCPKKYFYEYILRLTPEPQCPDYGNLGSRAHKVLEEFYRHVTIPCDPIEEFDSLIGRLYEHEFESIVDYRRNMITGLTNFLKMEIDRYNNLENKDYYIPKYNELYIKSEIVGIKFSGRIDVVYYDSDGELMATDFKFTNRNNIGDEQKQQAAIYTILLEKELGIKFNEFSFLFLRHKKPIKKVKITNSLIKMLNQKIYNISQNIDNMIFPRRQNWLCRYCGYESICLEEQAEGL